jgi:hypothetical protein
MSHADMRNTPTTGSTAAELNRPISSFQGRALLPFYLLVVTFAMAGWLWFLGWLSWEIVTRLVNAIS